jgi:signal transduction histidine kinase/HAMP domain-containing protein
VVIAGGDRDMAVRRILLLGFLAFTAALCLLGAWSAWWLHELGGASRRIIADNYDSVVAAQRMTQSLERQDSAVLFALLGETPRARAQLADHRRRVDDHLRAAAGNVTEPGEAALIARIQALRDGYYRDVDGQLAGGALTPRVYFDVLEPRFAALRGELDGLLRMNQEAMRRKSGEAAQAANAYVRRAVLLAMALVAVGVVGAGALARRIVRPLAELTRATDRMSTGDLEAVAAVQPGPRELQDLALSFNRLQARLRELRRSDLGRLRAAQQLAESAIDSLYDPVLVTDVDGRLTRANRAAEEAFGRDAIGTGRDIADLGGTALGAAVSRAIASGRSTGGDGAAGVTRVTTLGGDREYRLRATPLRGDTGELMGTVTLLEDVTHLREIDRVKSEFIAVASHELRTPLTSLLMGVQLLREAETGPLTERQRRLLEICVEDGERLRHLLQELLDVSRLEAGKDAVEPRPEPIGTVVEAVVATMRRAAESHGVRLTADVPAGRGLVLADPSQIQRVLTNLVDNAIRATDHGTVSVRVEPGREQTTVSVVDTGRGIAADQLPRLFEKFARPEGGASGGAGLGLFIARQIVERHGGRIWARSDLGRGAVFSFTLPNA